MTPAKLHSYLRRQSGLYLNAVDGEMWWSDSYVAAPVGATLSVLLDDYNLTPEPMCCIVGRTIKRDERKAPDLAKLVSAAKPKAKASRIVMRGLPVFVEVNDIRDRACELWQGGKLVVSVDRSKREIVDMEQDGDWWVQRTDSQPMVLRDGKSVRGLVMPVKSLLSAEDIAGLDGIAA